jgi:hypothetical protein
VVKAGAEEFRGHLSAASTKYIAAANSLNSSAMSAARMAAALAENQASISEVIASLSQQTNSALSLARLAMQQIRATQ